MGKEEILKECKQAYELLYDLLHNTTEDFNDTSFEETMEELGDIYSNNWDNNYPKQEVHCFRCGSKLKISDLIDYAYLCEECDENMYVTECETDYIWWDESAELKSELKELYEESLKDLKNIEEHISKYGVLDNGLSDSTESFEQGYVNALECVCNILDIELESEAV